MNTNSKTGVDAGQRLVRVYNRGNRTIRHTDENGVKWESGPGRFAEVPASIAGLWRRLYKKEFLDDQAAQADLDNLTAKIADLTTALETANKQSEELARKNLELAVKVEAFSALGSTPEEIVEAFKKLESARDSLAERLNDAETRARSAEDEAKALRTQLEAALNKRAPEAASTTTAPAKPTKKTPKTV